MRLDAAAGPARSRCASSASPRTSPASNMRLNAGGVRELHWHKAAEWAYMLYGRARITAIDAAGPQLRRRCRRRRSLVFPAGHSPLDPGSRPRRLRVPAGLRRRRASTRTTPSCSATGSSTRRRTCSARTSACRLRCFGNVPDPSQLYIFPRRCRARSPPTRSPARRRCRSAFSHRMMAQDADPHQERQRCASPTPRSFPASKTIAAALVEVDPGGMRELHWHPNTDEWQYYIEGKARMGVFAVVGRGPHLRLPGRRCRLCAVRHGPLHREHRRHAAALPGDVQEQTTTPTSRSITGWRSRRPSWCRARSSSTGA